MRSSDSNAPITFRQQVSSTPRPLAACTARKGSVQDQTAVTSLLFTDIEGSTRLWEQEPERMQSALRRHDAIVRSAIEQTGGAVVKMTGDGVHAAFADPFQAVTAALTVQR